MENKILSLEGKLSVLMDVDLFDAFCNKYLPTFDSQRFELVAFRVYKESRWTATIYAADRESFKTVRDLRYPVKKFKITDVRPHDLLFLLSHFNFTISAQDYEMDDMDITNR
jgi:hypothetical protein